MIDWWRRRRLTPPRIDRIHRYDSVADIPADLDRHTLAVVGAPETPKWVAMMCPCGHGHQLVVSLQRSHRPHWRLTDHDGGIGLHPSIDSVADGRCHFWLREGRVQWVQD